MHLIKLTALFISIFFAFGASAPSSAFNVPMSKELQQTVSMFGESRLIKVTDRVYLAYAFDIVNSVFVIGDDGVVIIDTMARVENAQRALAEHAIPAFSVWIAMMSFSSFGIHLKPFR